MQPRLSAKYIPRLAFKINLRTYTAVLETPQLLGLQVIPSAWLRIFNPLEVNEMLAGGESGALDVVDLQRHTEYSLGYTADSPAIRRFWKVVQELSVKEQQALMKFVTSCSRAPLGGFAHLVPPFSIQKVPFQIL